MANITKIKAKARPDDEPVEKADKTAQSVDSHPPEAPAKAGRRRAPSNTKKVLNKKPLPKALKVILAPFILISKPFRALGKYIASSWKEIRQVRWPNRKLTWKMTLAVVAYTALFIVTISALDALFTLIFNALIG
jgi:preprotein translocase SecE subunit